MTAKDYPITQDYGYDPSYPLNGGMHYGVDYGCPTGTAVVVNGVTIGLSGATGAVTGPHLHVGRWVGGKATNPGRGGFHFDSAVVTQVGSDSVNGTYVRVQGDGASWVYLHLSQQLVTVGQELKKGSEEPMLNDGDVTNIYFALLGHDADAQTKKNWTGHTFKELVYAILDSDEYKLRLGKDNKNAQAKLDQIKAIIG